MIPAWHSSLRLAVRRLCPSLLDVACIARRVWPQISSGSSAWHPFQDPCAFPQRRDLLWNPPKHDSVGKVQCVLSSILAERREIGNKTGLLAEATQTRLTAYVETQRLAAGSFPQQMSGGSNAHEPLGELLRVAREPAVRGR